MRVFGMNRRLVFWFMIGMGIAGCSHSGNSKHDVGEGALGADARGKDAGEDRFEDNTANADEDAGDVSHEELPCEPCGVDDAGGDNLSGADLEQLQGFLEELKGRARASGAALSVTIRGQSTTLVNGVRFDGAPAVDASTYFNIASISKSLTASHIVMLAHQDKLGLDEPISTYLPGVHLVDPHDSDVTADVSVRDLLRHRAGLPHQPGNQVDPATFNNDWSDPELLQKLTADWQLRLVSAPGNFHYSNMGYMLLGAIIENVERCHFADCMRRYLDSLGLERATFNTGDVLAQAAHGRVFAGDSASFNAPGWYASVYALPFNGAWISMPALAALGQILMDATDPSAPLFEMANPGGDAGGYGLGIIHGDRGGAATLEHDDSGPGFLARLVAIPERDIVLAVAANGGMESPEQAQQFLAVTNNILSVIDKTP